MACDPAWSQGTAGQPDGSVLTKDGNKMLLKEGQEIGTDGKMHNDAADYAKLHKSRTMVRKK